MKGGLHIVQTQFRQQLTRLKQPKSIRKDFRTLACLIRQGIQMVVVFFRLRWVMQGYRSCSLHQEIVQIDSKSALWSQLTPQSRF